MIRIKNFYRIFFLLILLFTFNFEGNSQSPITDEINNKAKLFLNKSKDEKHINLSFKNKMPLKLFNNNLFIGYEFDLLPQGFIVISPFDNSIMAYSFENNFFNENKEASKISLDILEKISYNSKLRKNKNTAYQRSPVSEIGPFVRSLFGQVNCYDANDNLINVSNLFTPNNYAPGCVAVSLATLMHYYKWPVVGMGKHTDKDTYGSSRGNYTAEFDKTYYDWANIKEKYKYQHTTAEQRKALGLLVYHAAIALDMDFEYNGSTSNVNRIPKAGANYFRYNAKYASASSPIFWRTVDTCMVHKIPVAFAISGSGGIGHSIVCDGVRFENGSSTFHHLNMGWWGSSNGWYNVKGSFNAGGYSKINGGAINFLPIPEIYNAKVNSDSTALTVYWRYSNVLPPESFELQVKYDDENWTTISDSLAQDSLNITLNSFENKILFRIRAKLLGKYSNDSWSNNFEFKKHINSIFDLSNNSPIIIFPNPFKNHINIFNKENSPVDLTIINMQTQEVVFHTEKTKKTEIINTQNWIPGAYIIMTRNDKLFLQKIIKTNH